MKYLKAMIIPLIVLSVFILLGFLWKLFHFPPQAELIPIIKSYFDKYGIVLVFISAILESAFVIGIYAPGGLVVFLGVIFSVGNPAQAVMVICSAILGFLIGFTVDFYMGRYGWYKLFLHFGFAKSLEKTKERIQKYGLSIPWLGYHDPNLGSLVATAYGILRFTYKRFLILTIFPVMWWCTFWGILAYILGMNALKLIGYEALIVVIFIWIIVRIVEIKIEERNNRRAI